MAIKYNPDTNGNDYFIGSPDKGWSDERIKEIRRRHREKFKFLLE